MKITVLGKPAPAHDSFTVSALETSPALPHSADPGTPHAPQNRTWHVPTEIPVAFVVNDTNYAVMMASPLDIEDFTVGFALTDGVIRHADEIALITIHHRDQGIDVRISLEETASARFSTRMRRRHLTANTGCGLCGLDSADILFEKLPFVAERAAAPCAGALRAALAALRDHQQLNQITRSVHGAAWADRTGSIGLIREDVGRHNAVDKVIGALVREKKSVQDGFLLVSSRCSYEIVEKAVRGGISSLLAVSAPTGFALDKAREAGIRIFCQEKDTVLRIGQQ